MPLGNLAVVQLGEPGANPINQSGYVSSRLLAAGVAESISVPATAAYVRLAATADIYVNFSGAATVPGDADDGSASELIKTQSQPEWRSVKGVTSISVISESTPTVTASFYTL